MASSQALFGLQLVRAAAEDTRLTADELREIVAFACSSYILDESEADEAKAAHSAHLLCEMFVKSRARAARYDDDPNYRGESISSAELRARLAEFERFARRAGESDDALRERIKAMIAAEEGKAAPVTPPAIDAPAIDAQATAAAILKAAAKARGEVVELPTDNPAAMAILRAAAKARNEPPPGGKL